jgi:dTDP-4-dehydrorhamnose reductase
MKILLTGGSGVLGKELVKYCKLKNYDIYAPSSSELDMNGDGFLILSRIIQYNPDVIIHAAALVDTLKCEEDPSLARRMNIEGTLNLVQKCPSNCKFVYISTEYVFDGREGYYDVGDCPNPINVYGKTKLAGENIVSTLKNYSIIRAPFIKKIYTHAFTDQFCSRYFVEELPEKIINNVLYNDKRVIHISPKKACSLYEHYIEKGIQVQPTQIPENIKHIIPKFSNLINSSIW